MFHESDPLQRLHDYARSHPTRLNILALIAQGRGGLLDPEDFRRELPDRPPVPVIEYHLLVLRQIGLVPD